MQDKKELCIICAYRGTCQKQFSLTAGKRCPEFTEDLTLKNKDTQAKTTEDNTTKETHTASSSKPLS